MKCGRMSASMKWRYLGHLQLLSKAKHSFIVMAKKEVCPRDEIADPPGTVVLPIGILAAALLKVWRLFVHCVVCNVAGEICSESSECSESATVAGTVRDYASQPCVLLS